MVVPLWPLSATIRVEQYFGTQVLYYAVLYPVQYTDGIELYPLYTAVSSIQYPELYNTVLQCSAVSSSLGAVSSRLLVCGCRNKKTDLRFFGRGGFHVTFPKVVSCVWHHDEHTQDTVSCSYCTCYLVKGSKGDIT